MTLGVLLKRLGFLLIALAIAGAAIPRVVDSPALSARPDLPRNLGVLGAVLIAAAYGIELLGLAGARCRRCGRLAAPGSVFCAKHRNDLSRLAHEAAMRQRRDRSDW